MTIGTPISFIRPRAVEYGIGAIAKIPAWIAANGYSRVFVVCDPALIKRAGSVTDSTNATVEVFTEIVHEPETENFEVLLSRARAFNPDAIVGLGGGTVMDSSKLASVLVRSERGIYDVLADGTVGAREVGLALAATTAGTGSEVGPRAIITDSRTNGKQGIAADSMVADIAVIDPELTVGMPPSVTASTGIDALAHCLEAYTNKFAHPAADLYALEGTRLITTYLERAVNDGNDLEARSAMSMASLYGGYCLGPVNTHAGHALAYPLGVRYHMAHGVSNALVLSYVVEFNLSACRERMAKVALAMGATGSDIDELAESASRMVRGLCERVGIELKLSRLGVREEDLEPMADEAFAIKRLMNNNPRDITRDDVLGIYRAAY